MLDFLPRGLLNRHLFAKACSIIMASASAPHSPRPDPVRTLLMLDLESTGLPQLENNRTRITELAAVACARVDIARHGPLSGSAKPADQLPRMLHKLTLCVDPERTIQLEAVRLTRLSNAMLSAVRPFDAAAGALLAAFVGQLPQPVCLVAHNGDVFDFRLLRKELERVNVVGIFRYDL